MGEVKKTQKQGYEKNSIRNYVYYEFHILFQSIINEYDLQGKKILEVGCANSQWLPYFAKEYNLEIYGLDYSNIGCENSKNILNTEGVDGEIVCADLFEPPNSFIEKFDIVISFGVIEHFENTEYVVESIAKMLKPGGVMVTFIPNMNGLPGFIQKKVSKEIYDIHVPLDLAQLVDAHEKAGISMGKANYFLFFNMGIINFAHSKFKFIYYGLILLSIYIFGFLSKINIKLKENKVTSPYLFYYGEKEMNNK